MTANTDRVKGLSAEAANELRQRLETIILYAQGCARQIRAGALDMQELPHILDRIGAEGLQAGVPLGRLTDLIGRDAPTRQWVDINEVVRNAVPPPLVQERRGMTILLDLMPAALPVHVDRSHIEYAILNLLRNAYETARHLNADRCTIAIGTALQPDGGVQVTVREVPRTERPTRAQNGDGVRQGDASGQSEERLSMSCSIVEDHGGTLRVVSNAGHGITFEVVLPDLKQVASST